MLNIFKKTIIYRFTFAVLLLLSVSCRKDGTVEPLPTPVNMPGVFVVNEGNFTFANASLLYYHLPDQKIIKNLFYATNKVPLGDVANYMMMRENKGYIVVNNSGIVYKIDLLNGAYLGKLSNLTSPREVLILNKHKGYISDLIEKKITVFDPETMEKTGEIDLHGRTSESMLYDGKKTVFVANWSKYYQELPNDKVLVIDVLQDSVTDTIQVNSEPNSMVLDKSGNLWVLCSGGFDGQEYPALHHIDINSLKIIRTYLFPDKSSNPDELRFDIQSESLYFLDNGVYKMSIHSEELPETPIIFESENQNFYTIGIDPVTMDIYVSDARDYVRNGLINIYSNNGTLTNTFEAGIIPGTILFYR